MRSGDHLIQVVPKASKEAAHSDGLILTVEGLLLRDHGGQTGKSPGLLHKLPRRHLIMSLRVGPGSGIGRRRRAQSRRVELRGRRPQRTLPAALPKLRGRERGLARRCCAV